MKILSKSTISDLYRFPPNNNIFIFDTHKLKYHKAHKSHFKK